MPSSIESDNNDDDKEPFKILLRIVRTGKVKVTKKTHLKQVYLYMYIHLKQVYLLPAIAGLPAPVRIIFKISSDLRDDESPFRFRNTQLKLLLYPEVQKQMPPVGKSSFHLAKHFALLRLSPSKLMMLEMVI